MPNFVPSIEQLEPPVIEPVLAKAEIIQERNIRYDYISLKMWNTDHSGTDGVAEPLKEMWFDDQNDTYALRESGVETNYVQGDYAINAIELYHYDSTKEKPENLTEVYQKCKRIALLTKANEHYDISGKPFNVSVYYLTRGRVKGGTL
ncbi:MAG: hypothetical protein PUH99_01790 [Firmicutes bacterium]|nr:hypothetical protein [Bacillota bacterium]MDY5531876.1 hypothetical protein [Pumilibacteraceae bacterium]